MLECNIRVAGKTSGDVRLALVQAAAGIEAGDSRQSKRTQDWSYLFTVRGEANAFDDQDPPRLTDRYLIGTGEQGPVTVATMAGAGDVEVQLYYSDRTARQVVHIDTEEAAEFEIRINGKRIAQVRKGGDVIDVAPPTHE